MADEQSKSGLQDCEQRQSESAAGVGGNASHAEADTTKQLSKKKVEVLLKAAGDAPIMKKKKWSVDGTKTVAYLIEFIRKYIKCEPSDSLFLYVGQSYAPCPDQLVQNIYDCFGADGKLVFHYCKSQAWG